MFKFAANLTLLFTDDPFHKRIARARAAGFRHIEFHNPHPYENDLQQCYGAVEQCDVQVIHFNLPCPGWEEGERGIASRPDLTAEFRAGVTECLEIAERLECRQINCPVGNRHLRFSQQEQMEALVANLAYAAAELARKDMTLLIEPLNPLTHPAYLLTTTRGAVELQDRVAAANLKIQYDYYQMQRSEGNLAETVRCLFPRLGFVQVADNPGRHQPGTGEINFRFLLNDLAQLGYSEFVSLEYKPLGDPAEWFNWIREYGFEDAMDSSQRSS